MTQRDERRGGGKSSASTDLPLCVRHSRFLPCPPGPSAARPRAAVPPPRAARRPPAAGLPSRPHGRARSRGAPCTPPVPPAQAARRLTAAPLPAPSLPLAATRRSRRRASWPWPRARTASCGLARRARVAGAASGSGRAYARGRDCCCCWDARRSRLVAAAVRGRRTRVDARVLSEPTRAHAALSWGAGGGTATARRAALAYACVLGAAPDPHSSPSPPARPPATQAELVPVQEHPARDPLQRQEAQLAPHEARHLRGAAPGAPWSLSAG